MRRRDLPWDGFRSSNRAAAVASASALAANARRESPSRASTTDPRSEGDEWRTKWDGRWHYEAREGAFRHESGGTALVFAVEPAKVFAFRKGTFSQTRHRF
jgi:hypothetical protein